MGGWWRVGSSRISRGLSMAASVDGRVRGGLTERPRLHSGDVESISFCEGIYRKTPKITVGRKGFPYTPDDGPKALEYELRWYPKCIDPSPYVFCCWP